MLSITQCEITLPQTTPKIIQPLERCRDQKKSPMPRPATTVMSTRMTGWLTAKAIAFPAASDGRFL